MSDTGMVLSSVCDAGISCPEGTDVVDCTDLIDGAVSADVCDDNPKSIDRNGHSCEDLTYLYIYFGEAEKMQVVDYRDDAADQPADFCVPTDESTCTSSMAAKQTACYGADENMDEPWYTTSEGWAEYEEAVGFYQKDWTDDDRAKILRGCPRTCDDYNGCAGWSFWVWILILVGVVAVCVGVCLLLAAVADQVAAFTAGAGKKIQKVKNDAIQRALSSKDEHQLAGLRVWKTAATDASTWSSEKMALELERIKGLVTHEYGLCYHFTDASSADFILRKHNGNSDVTAGGTGIRAARAGQLGGGVSVCVTSPVEFGWEAHQGGDFRKNVGLALWGSKWYEVMDGEAPESESPKVRKDWGLWKKKLEVLLVLRVPKVMLGPEGMKTFDDRYVPDRDNVLILPKQMLVPSEKEFYLSNTDVVKALVVGETPYGPLQEEGKDDTGEDEAGGGGKTGLLTKIKAKKGGRGGGGGSEKKHPPLAMGNFVDAVQRKGIVDDRLVTWFEKGVPAADVNVPRSVLWDLMPEGVARFTKYEMTKNLAAIHKKCPTCCDQAYYFCSAKEAEVARKSGIPATDFEHTDQDGVRVVLTSPVDLGWDQYCLDANSEKPSEFLTRLRELLGDVKGEDVEVMLVLKVPSVLVKLSALRERAQANGADEAKATKEQTMLIPEESLWKPKLQVWRRPFFSRSHIEKCYRLEGAAPHGPAAVSELAAEPEPEPEPEPELEPELEPEGVPPTSQP